MRTDIVVTEAGADFVIAKERPKDARWKQAVDQLFNVLDPLANTSATERQDAIDSFFYTGGL